MKETENQEIITKTYILPNPIMNVFYLALVYQSFIETLNLNFSLSRMLSAIFLLSMFSGVLSTFKVKPNTTLVSLFFITLALGTIKAFKAFSLPTETTQLFDKAFYGAFLSITFLIIIVNVSNRSFDRAIVFNSTLALFCASSQLLKHFQFTLPEKLYNYIPLFFLTLNLIIYASRPSRNKLVP